ncbi:hypothetical protein LCGC14_2493210 [marine sediment metagenome]|uniref:Uncharacterized protein n=1 Tax=marine sediment metagenome TaxID=412755 RepID=A0A0F9DFZ2_9ZZZZ
MLNMKKAMLSTRAYWNVIQELAGIPPELHDIFIARTNEGLVQYEANILIWKTVGLKARCNRKALVKVHQFPVKALGWSDRYFKIRVAIETKLRKSKYKDSDNYSVP